MWMLVLTSAALAATLSVEADGSGDYTSIKDAIAAASDGDELLIGPGTYPQPLDLRVVDLTLRSTDGPDTTIIDAGGLVSRMIQTRGNDTLIGLTLRNGDQGAISATTPSLELEDMVFDGLGSSGSSGNGVELASGGSANLMNCTFQDLAGAYGAGIYGVGADITCTDCTFIDNHALGGAAVTLDGGRLFLTGGLFQDNGDESYGDTSPYGGALHLVNGANLTATDTVFEDNTAYAGGVLYLGTGGSAVLTGVTVTGNSSYLGGALYLEPTTELDIDRSHFEGNGHSDYATAITYGGVGVVYGPSTVSIADSTFVRNHAYYGGAFYTSSVNTLDVVVSTFEQNLSYYGGAFYNYYLGTWTVTDSLFDTNTGYYGGGAAYEYVVTDTVLSGNTWLENQALYGVGGAIYQYYPTTWSSTESTWDGNLGAYAGGAIYLYYLRGPVEFLTDSFTGNEATYAAGGALWAYYQENTDGDLVVRDTTFQYNVGYQGGGFFSSGLDVLVRNTRIQDNQATFYGGGGIWADTGDLTLIDVTVEGNTAAAEGGGVAHKWGNQFSMEGTRITGNQTDSAGGGLYLKSVAAIEAHGAELSGNDAKYGGGLYQADCVGGEQLWTNVRVQDNAARFGGGIAVLEGDITRFENISVVSNLAVDAGAAFYLYGNDVELWNSVVAFHDGVAAIYAEDALSGGSEIVFNAMYANTAGDLEGPWAQQQAAVTDHPLLSLTLDGDPSDDSLVPLVGSPLFDAGSPQILDGDGGPSDIGATGGPWMVLTDGDGDGVRNNLDCDDADSDAKPGGDEVWYDGVNGDCSGLSDFDQDGDGHDSDEHGGDDCRDEDPKMWDTCPDGGGSPDAPGDGDTGRCATAGGSTGGAWLLAGLIGLARRRR